mmetsp:Transcript_6469/g.19059  ORF Transcript_6469/g.19059 Transcript_6469/m.19059 type:complete len:93 (-) Transcript_6469:46-324(-)
MWEHDRLRAVVPPPPPTELEDEEGEGRTTRGLVVCDDDDDDADRPNESAHSYRRYVCCITMMMAEGEQSPGYCDIGGSIYAVGRMMRLTESR